MTVDIGWLEINQLKYTYNRSHGEVREQTKRRIHELFQKYGINDTPNVTDTAGSTTTDSPSLLDVEHKIISSIVHANYNAATNLLLDFSFSTQVSSLEHLEENMYLRYLFYQYIITLYSSVYFPDEFLSTRPLDSIIKKVKYYYTKNELLFANKSTELDYYNIINFYHLTTDFKQFKIVKFLKEFEKFDIILFLQGCPFNSNILCLFQVAQTLLKPFNQLSLLNKDLLLDEINHHTLSKYIYDSILSPLLDSDFTTVQETFKNPEFIDYFNNKLGFFLPIGLNKLDFLDYFHRIIDFKIFLLILSNISLIPKSKLLELMGYKNLDKEKEFSITNDLLLVITTLNLGNSNIGYDYNQDCFYNHEKGSERDLLDLKDNVDRLTVDLHAESIANSLKGALIDRLTN